MVQNVNSMHFTLTNHNKLHQSITLLPVEADQQSHLVALYSTVGEAAAAACVKLIIVCLKITGS